MKLKDTFVTQEMDGVTYWCQTPGTIEDTIKLVNVRYDGLNDKRNFMELSASLEAVRDNVGRYYAEDSRVTLVPDPRYKTVNVK